MAAANAATLKITIEADDRGSLKIKNIGDVSDQAGKRSDAAFRQVGRTLESLTIKALAAAAAGAAALSAGLLSAVRTGMQYDSTMAEVKGVSRATAEEFEAMDRIAKQLGETTEWSASQAGEGLKYLSMAGFKAEQSIKALPGVLDLATAGKIELGEAADIASNALTAMRLEVEDLGRVNDVMVSTITTSNTDMRMMAESFKYAAPVAAGYGVQIETLSGLIGMLGNAGIQGSMAGTQLAQAFGKVSGVFEKYNVSATRADGSTRDIVDAVELLQDRGATAAEIMDIFDERSGRAMLALTGMSRGALREYIDKLHDASGATKTLADIMRDNLTGDVKGFQSVIEGIKIDFFRRYEQDAREALQSATRYLRDHKEELIAAVGGMVDKVVQLAKEAAKLEPLIRGLGKAFGWLIKNMDVIAGLAAINLVLPKVAAGAATLVTGIRALTVSVGTLTTATVSLGTAMAAAQIGLTAFFLAYKAGEWLAMHGHVKAIADETDRLNRATAALNDRFAEISQATGVQVRNMEELDTAVEQGRLRFDDLTATWVAVKDAAAETGDSIGGIGTAMDNAAAGTDRLAEAEQKLSDQQKQLIDEAKKRADEQKRATEEMYREAGIGGDRYFEQEADKLVKKASNWQKAGEDTLAVEQWLYDELGKLSEKAWTEGQEMAGVYMDNLQAQSSTLVDQFNAIQQEASDKLGQIAAEAAALDGSQIGLVATFDGSAAMQGLDQLIARIYALREASAGSVGAGSGDSAPAAGGGGGAQAGWSGAGDTYTANTVINVNQQVSRSDVVAIAEETKRRQGRV